MVLKISQTRYTLGRRIDDDRHHITTIHGHPSLAIWPSDLETSGMKSMNPSRNLSLSQKVLHFLVDALNKTPNWLLLSFLDWTPVPAYNTLIHIVCRTSNRYFVGLPLCKSCRCISYLLDVLMCFALNRPGPRLLRSQWNLCSWCGNKRKDY